MRRRYAGCSCSSRYLLDGNIRTEDTLDSFLEASKSSAENSWDLASRREIAQGGNPRHEKVGTPAHAHELRHRGDAPARPARSGTRQPVGWPPRRQRNTIPDQRIAFVEPRKLRIVEPRGLDELELPGDVGVQADETQA